MHQFCCNRHFSNFIFFKQLTKSYTVIWQFCVVFSEVKRACSCVDTFAYLALRRCLLWLKTERWVDKVCFGNRIVWKSRIGWRNLFFFLQLSAYVANLLCLIRLHESWKFFLQIINLSNFFKRKAFGLCRQWFVSQ